MHRTWKVLASCLLFTTQACSDSAGPGLPPTVPHNIVVPSAVLTTGVPTAAIGASLSETGEEVPAEYQQEAVVKGRTVVGFSDQVARGYAETNFSANVAKHDMKLAVTVNGSPVASELFSEGFSTVLPISSSLIGTGELPAPSCGAAVSAKTGHEASVVYNGRQLSSATTTSSGSPVYQPACPTQTSTDTSTSSGGSNGGDGETYGTILTICTTTWYYSASGEYLYSTRECRQEYHEQ